VWHPDASTGFLQLCCNLPTSPHRLPFQAPALTNQMGCNRSASRAKALGNRGILGPRLRALDVGPHCVGLGLDPLHPVFHEVANRHDAANLPALNNWKMTDSLLGDERKRV